MTAYDDDAERLGAECELCGEIGLHCRCDDATATEGRDCPACNIGNPGVYVSDGRMVCPHRPEAGVKP